MNEYCTDIELISHEFKWTVNKLKLHMECGRLEQLPLKSPLFTVGNDQQTKWHITLEIVNNSYEPTFIRCSLVCNRGKSKSEIVTNITATFFNQNGVQFLTRNVTCKIVADEQSISLYRNWYTEFLEIASICNLNVGITIICQFDIVGDTITTGGNIDIPKVIVKKLSCDFSELLESESFADVLFNLSDGKLKAHKTILAARSSVFAAMFHHQMQEQNENVVKIDDIEFNVFKGMLQYIYTNEVHDLENIAMNLLYAADKYGLDDLKEMCAVSIWKKITVNNAAEVYMFADRHNLKQLAIFMENFMQTCVYDVIETSGYKILQKENPNLDLKLCRTVMEKYRNIQRHEEDKKRVIIENLSWILGMIISGSVILVLTLNTDTENECVLPEKEYQYMFW